ncbi:MAG: sigma factor [Eggerthellaceae bacterium]
MHVPTPVALESAMERWGDTVLRLATSRMGSVADAEDVFQTVFMRLLQSRAVHRRRASEGVASARDDQLLQRRAPQPLEQAPRRA